MLTASGRTPPAGAGLRLRPLAGASPSSAVTRNVDRLRERAWMRSVSRQPSGLREPRGQRQEDRACECPEDGEHYNGPLPARRPRPE